MAGTNRIRQGLIKVLNDATATGAGVALDVSEYKCIRLQLATKNSADATIKFAVSESATMPNFGIAASYTNRYTYAQVADYDSGNTINGSTGIVLTGTDVIANYELNTNEVKWMCPIVTAYSAGDLDIDCQAINDYTR